MTESRPRISRVPSTSSSTRLPFLLSVLGLTLALSACGQGAASRAAPTATPQATPAQVALAPPLPASYAALGASETFGIGATPHTAGYAYRIARALHTRHFVDAGIPGTTLDAGYQTELAAALSIRPSLCTVFFGVNDLRDGITRANFLSDLHDLVATLRQAHARVLIIGMPDLSLVPAAKGIPHLHATVVAWNDGMRQVARQTGARFLDLTSFTPELASHPQYIAADGLHPSTEGHARLAAVILAGIRHAGIWRAQ